MIVNYLAHVYLADVVGASLTGNLMGDFVRGPLAGRFPESIELGLRLHRRVDVFTDAHPVPRISRRRFKPPFRRYAGIMVDVFYDHCLARHWADYHDEPLTTFSARVYESLTRDHAALAEPLKSTHARMGELDILASYRQMAGVERALAHLSRRFSRANPLAAGGAPLRAHYRGLELDFRAFMPALIAHVKQAWPLLQQSSPLQC
jgi:acyl carrier protein phosphodiesterase